MMPTQGVVRVRRLPASLEVQIEGSGTMLESQAIRQWVEANLGEVPLLRTDLSRCTYMDSTFIGTLLRLKRFVESRSGGALVIVCPSVECLYALEKMRIGRVFTFESDLPTGEQWQELHLEPDVLKSRNFKCNVVDAHQQLAACEGPTGDRFRQLANEMARELEQDS